MTAAVAARDAAEVAARPTRRLLAVVHRRSGLTRSGLVLVGVAVAAWLLARVVAGRPLYLLAYCAIGLLVLFRLGSRRAPAVTATRSATVARVVEGASVDLSVTLTAARNVSTLILEEALPPSLGQQVTLAVPELAAGASVEHAYTVTAWRRGVYEIGPLVIRWGDPFGLTQREAPLAEKFELLVHPRIEPLVDRPLTRMWEDPPMRPPISRPWPSGLEFYGMRPYQPGDDIRRIVWRAYARTGQLLVREAEQGISDKVIIVFDDDHRFHSAGVVSDSFEAAVRAAASVGVHHLKAGYRVTLLDTTRTTCEALRSGPAVTRFLDSLARAEAGDGRLADAISRLVVRGESDAHVFVVTPHLEMETAARLELLLQRGMQVTVVALVWDEEHAVALPQAAAFGAQIVEVRPNTPLSVAFRRTVGTGHR